MSIIETLVEKFPIRKSRKQKDAFREWFIDWAREQGYTAEETAPKGIFRSSNVVVGDPESAQVVFTAHYDTPAVMILPNFITPRNVLFYILYRVYCNKETRSMTAGLYLVLYSIGRFILEFFRGDESRGFIMGLSTSQFIAIFLCIAGLILVVRRRSAEQKAG